MPRETKWISNSQTPVKKHSLTQKKDDDDGNNYVIIITIIMIIIVLQIKMMMITIIIMIIIIIIIVIKGCWIQIKQGCIQIKDQGRIIKQEKYTYTL